MAESDVGLRAPHTAFVYPALQPWPEPPEQALNSMARLLWPRAPEHVRFFASSRQAVAHFLDQAKLARGGRVATPVFCDADLRALLHERGIGQLGLNFLQGEGFDPAALGNIDAIYLPNPNPVDGAYLPQPLLNSLYSDIRAAAPELPILFDQRCSLFSFDPIGVGSIEGKLLNDNNLYSINSSKPLIDPHGPELSWVKGKGVSTAPAPLSLNPAQLAHLAALVVAFNARQGAWVNEFRKRLLVMERGLRIFAEGLRPVMERGELRVPLWPLAGYHLLVDVRPLLQNRGYDSGELVRRLETRGLLLEDGAAYGAEGHVRLCFAQPLPLMQTLGPRLANALLDAAL